jgi:hypothetical protein
MVEVMRLVVLGVAAITAISNETAATELNLTIRETTSGLEITNPNSFDIAECDVTVNSRYKTGRVRVRKNGVADVRYSELISGTDDRYNPASERLQRVQIECFRPIRASASFER